jgi:colanic acid/amylovoran biosynthesis glycosyltransferase
VTAGAAGAGRPLRVAYLADTFPVLAETPYLNIATGLLRRGHDVQAFALACGRGALHPDVEALGLMARTHYPVLQRTQPGRGRVPRAERAARMRERYRAASPAARAILRRARNPFVFGARALTLDAFFEAERFVGQAPFDVAYCAFGRDGRAAVRLRRAGALVAPFAVSFRGRDVTHYPRAKGPGFYRDVFREASLLLPMCRAFVARLEALGAPREKIVVHPTGIDVRRFAFRAPEPPAAGEALRLVSVARLHEKKGLAYAIAAVGRLRDAGVPVRYDVAGDGPLRAALEAEVAARGLGGVVHLRGAMPQLEVRDLMRASHLLLAPSVVAADGDEEGLPTVIKEALATGVPVVATRHSGIPELVHDGETGRLVPERDDAALAAAIRDMLDARARWGEYAANGRRHVERDYDIERLNDRLVELLRAMS